MTRGFIRALACAALLSSGAAVPAGAQVKTNVPPAEASARPLIVERIKVNSPALAGNLEGNSADREVIVMLPANYRTSRLRYPVVYALHGYSIGADQWSKEIHVPQTIEGAVAKGAKDMIVVFPDSKTVHNGSMYSGSPTTGDFETFVSRDLVAHVDRNYRTIARRESRGLVGHSMGGYGASRIGMKHSDVFGALYMMSPCCLSARAAAPLSAEATAALATIKAPADAAKLPWGVRAQFAAAAAWSPNPKNPPLYFDLPLGDEAQKRGVLDRWAANAPLAFVDQYIGGLRRYKAIAIDVGDRDGLKADAQKLHETLDRYGVANSFEIYSGDHTSDVAVRFQEHVMPFFSRNLAFEARK